MKTSKEQLQKMYEYMKEQYENEYCSEIYDLKRLYNDFSEEFWLDTEFWVDGCEYWGDDEIYCFVYANNIWSIVFDRSVKRYTDENFYKDAVNYLLELQEQAEKIIEKLEKLEKADY